MASKISGSEIHLFIIWEKARNKENKILENITANLRIVDKFNVRWDKNVFSNNLTRFYGKSLPDRSFKERHCGIGEFSAIIVEDIDPKYELRTTSRGSELVNSTMFDLKSQYRSWTGGGHKIHGTTSIDETKHDLSLLLGLKSKPYFEESHGQLYRPPTDTIGNLVGTKHWESLTELFYVLNMTSNYLVLRNHEYLPDQFTVSEHNDIDLLVEDYESCVHTTNAKRVYKWKTRVLHTIRVKDVDVLFDFRHLGDGYYDTAWQKKMLDEKVMSYKGFYKMDLTNHFYSLLYHALIHKHIISPDYITALLDLSETVSDSSLKKHCFNENNHGALQILDKFVSHKGYKYTFPYDFSVRYNSKLNKHVVKYFRVIKYMLTRTMSVMKTKITPASIYRWTKEHIMRRMKR